MACTGMTSRMALAPAAAGLSARRSIAPRTVMPTLPARPVVLRNSIVTKAGLLSKEKKAVTKGRGYDKSAPEVPAGVPAFTRRKEVWAGRIAMVGFFSNVLAELVTGEGALGQLRLYTGAPQNVIDALVFGLVAFNFVTALSPGSPTFSKENQEDIKKRPAGPVQNSKLTPVTSPIKYFGTSSEFGFTKKNELFVGRWAMLGFAASIIGEKLTGKGPIGQIGLPLDLPINPAYTGFGLAIWIGFFLAAAIGFGNYGETEGDEDIY